MASKGQKRANNPVRRKESGEPASSFPIVGVGASAGGLVAFTELLKHLPLDTGMGFVLVQHLDPEHESALTQLLARATKMPVREITNNQRVEANRVYVIPPNTNLGIARGVLKLRPRPEARTPHRSIDFFFESLAEDQCERAIGVILSGTASDGTLGLTAIKAEGGITFVQDDSARYDSMPRSAVAAGCVDFVLSPEDIAKELTRIAKHPYVAGQSTELPTSPEDDRAHATAHADDATPLPSGGRGAPPTGAEQARAEAGRGREEGAEGVEDDFKKILLLLRNHSGVDLSLYRSTTLQRRITRRMVLQRQDTLERYAHFLRGNAKELDALYSDALISVTSFFRNPEAFDALKRTVFPRLLERRGDQPFRAWVLGCSTGQEAYSIAMAFVEAAEHAPRMPKLQVFATDLNEALLDKARHGLYARSLAEDISPERLRQFFVEEEGGYRIVKSLRERIVFARQNLISDPPFSRMDLISCRNLLIYLEPSLQKKALPTFHYALKPGGFLFLGASESIGGFTDLFEPADKKHKIYSKKPAPTPALHLPARKEHGKQPSPGLRPPSPHPMGRGQGEGFRGELNAEREADRITVHQFAPPGVLVNAELQILQFRGPTGAYLEPPAGKASFEVLKMAREGLMLPLRAAIHQAKKENKTARKDNVRIQQNGKTRAVNLEVIPLKNLHERCFLILFEEAEKAGRAGPRAPAPKAIEPPDGTASAEQESNRIAELETDLSETREYLQSIQEQHEAANEELQATNEEVQSANEELQSMNEELETSKEELESANEELTTVNEEMSHRNVELNRLNSDLINLQTSTQIALVLLGRDLTIRRFSPQAEKQFDLLASDVGRPISHIRHHLVLADGAGSPLELEGLGAEVIASVREQEHEVQDKAGRWYSLRVRPYLMLDNQVDGAVLVLLDIDDLKRSEQAVATARDYAEAIIRTVRDPLVILDAELRVHTANEAFYSTFKVSPTESEGRLIYELGNRQWQIPKLRRLLEDILPRNSFFNDFEVTHDFEGIGRRTMLLNARRLEDTGGRPARILLGIHDVTEALQFQAAARESQARYEALIEASAQIVWTTAPGGAVVEDSPSWRAFTGKTYEQSKGSGWLDALHPEDRERVDELWRRAVAERTPVETEYRVRHVSGDWRWMAGRTVPVWNPNGSVREWVGMNIDISYRKRAEEELRRHTAQFETLLNEVPLGVYLIDGEFRIRHVNPSTFQVFGDIPDLIGRDFDEVIHLLWPKAYADEIVQLFRHTLETGEPYSTPERIEERLDRGVTEYYEWQINRIPLPEGGFGVVCYFREISARVLAEQRLRESEERLRLSDRHKNEFLAMLAHELRNPLAPIRNALEAIRLTSGNWETVHSAFEMMERQVGQMVRLVDDLLDVSRISRGKIELRKGRVELASVVHHAVEAARPLTESLGHELSVTLPPKPMYLNADPTRLAQVVGNLLNNACKFTDQGGRIWLTVEREPPLRGNEGVAVIRVRDSGIGIAADQLPCIFDMFMQVDTSLERSASGLGIGLTLVKNLVEMHGGTVDVHSGGVGEGSEFVVRLPLASDEWRAVSGEKAGGDPLATRHPPPVTKRRILVVDDNPDSAESLALLLQLSGHETHMAHDGLEAVEAAERWRPDVVLLDIGLPQLNGYDACRRIRAEPWGQAMVLIALSGWGQEEDRRQSQDAGFEAHLVKPVDYGALMKLLATLPSEQAG